MTAYPFWLALLSLQAAPQVPGTGAAAAADSAIVQIGETVTNTGQMLLEGQWAAAIAAVQGSIIEMAGGLLPGLIRAVFVGAVTFKRMERRFADVI